MKIEDARLTISVSISQQHLCRKGDAPFLRLRGSGDCLPDISGINQLSFWVLPLGGHGRWGGGEVG